MATPKSTFYKIGKDAHVFYDAKTQLKVSEGKPGKLSNFAGKKIKEALGNGHIIQIEEPEYTTLIAAHNAIHNPVKVEVTDLKASVGGKKETTSKKDSKEAQKPKEEQQQDILAIPGMSKEQLLAFLEESYELSDSEKEENAAMDLDALKTLALKWEAEASQD